MDQPIEPEVFLLEDADEIPNNPRLPLVIYPQAFDPANAPEKLAAEIEARLPDGGWIAAWRYGVYDFPHYHSTAHEMLGCYRGAATIRFGYTKGVTLRISAGDVAIIPAGVGHQNLVSTADFQVVGGYPTGQSADLLRGRAGERPLADENIALVPLPSGDPVFGRDGPLRQHWGL